jgi:hypothetical protein
MHTHDRRPATPGPVVTFAAVACLVAMTAQGAQAQEPTSALGPTEADPAVASPGMEPNARSGRAEADAGRKGTGYEAALGYGNVGEYNGGRLSLIAPLSLGPPRLRAQAYVEVGGYFGEVTIGGREARRTVEVLGLGLQAKPAAGRTYVLFGAGVYYTRYTIPRLDQAANTVLAQRAGLGLRSGLGYLTGQDVYLELNADVIPIPDTVVGGRRTMLGLTVGKRF